MFCGETFNKEIKYLIKHYTDMKFMKIQLDQYVNIKNKLGNNLSF